MPRPIWKGYITFGLVNIPVILYPAEKKFDIQFKMIDSRDQSKIRYLRVNEHTGEEVPWNQITKAYEYDENSYVIIKPEDIKAISGEHSKTIDIESFINKEDINYLTFEKPYYLVPDKKGEKGYVILRETFKTTKKVGIARVIIHTREYLAALLPYENALVLNLLRYPQEIRTPAEFELPEDNIKNFKITPKELEIAKQLVASMTVKWMPENYHDTFRESLQRWIEEKVQQGQKPEKKKRASKLAASSNVVNFVDLLKKSLQTTNKKKQSTKR